MLHGAPFEKRRDEHLGEKIPAVPIALRFEADPRRDPHGVQRALALCAALRLLDLGFRLSRAAERIGHGEKGKHRGGAGKGFMHLVSRRRARCNRLVNAKADVRQQVRTLLNLSPNERASKSALICDRIQALACWREARTVALFAPLRKEPNVELLWSARDGKTFCFPRVQTEALAFYRVGGPAELLTTRGALREPAESMTLIAPETLDVILVPGVAFTRGGQRLGRGGGYYDRFLAQPELRARTIGVCFDVQLFENLPAEPHDRAVDLVISESAD